MKAIHAKIGLTIVMAGMVLVTSGCGQQSDPGSGERAITKKSAALSPLGGFVAIQQHYAQATEGKQEEVQHAQHVQQDRALMAKLSEEYLDLRREWEGKLKEHVDDNPLPWPVEFTALPGRPYTFTSFAITGAGYRGGLSVSGDLIVDDDMTDSELLPRTATRRTGLTLCFKALDGKGQEIEGTRKCTVADGNRLREDWVAGSTSSARFSFGTREIIQMGDFGGVVEITREEYQTK